MANNPSHVFHGLIPRGLENQIRDIKVRTDRTHEMATTADASVKKALSELDDLRERVRELEAAGPRRGPGRPPKVVA